MEKGEELKGGFNVSIFFMTEEEAKQYVADVFKRNETDTDFVKALENNDYTKDTLTFFIIDNLSLTATSII